MKVLVTGAAGFVGSALVRRLVADRLQVRAVVRRAPELLDPEVDWVVGCDLGGEIDWAALLAGVDAVVHLAGLAHQVGRQGHGRTAEFMFQNAEITRRLATAARLAGVRRFVLLGSVAAIGPHDRSPISESADARPDTDYGRSKLAAEREVVRELDGSGTSWVILRSPLVYGPGNPGNMDRLLRLIMRRLPLPFAGIDNLRSFVFIDNLVDAILVTLRAPQSFGGLFFVDDGTRYSTAGLCQALATAARTEARLINVPVRLLQLAAKVGDAVEFLLHRSVPLTSYSVDRLVGSLVVDGTLFRNATGWRPPVAPAEGLRRTVEYVTRSARVR